MSSDHDLPSIRMAEAAMRVELAAAELDVSARMQTVIRSFTMGLPFDDVDVDVDVEVAASVGLGRTTWRASGDTPSMIGPMLDFFDLVGADTERQARLTDFGQRVQPDRLGHWLQMRGDQVDAGWFAPSELALTDALAETPASDARDTFANWCDDEDIDTVLGFERSLGPANYGGHWFELPGADPDAQVAAFEELMDDLEIGSLPVAQRGILCADDRAALAGSVWLIAEGVARVSVAVLDPDPSVLIALSMAAGSEAETDQLLARVQGALNADKPSLAEAVLYDGVADAEFAWHLVLSS